MNRSLRTLKFTEKKTINLETYQKEKQKWSLSKQNSGHLTVFKGFDGFSIFYSPGHYYLHVSLPHLFHKNNDIVLKKTVTLH